MNWIKKIFKMFFSRNKVLMLKEPLEDSEKKIEKRNNFKLELKIQADIEIDFGNGYKIRKYQGLEDWV